MALTRVRLGVLVLSALVALTVPACSTDPAGQAAAEPADTDGAYPVTIEHLWGATTIEKRPERVVSLGATDADVALALGVTPVATTGLGFFDTGLGPWALPLVAGGPPQKLEVEPNLELIASLRPDLILGVSAGFEEAVYQRLSAIAPTVVRPAGAEAYQVSREDSTRIIGTALGQRERAEELDRSADARFEQAIAEHPEFVGRTGVVVMPSDGRYGVFTPRDARGRVMAELGFELPPALAALDTGDEFYIDMSREQVQMLDADVLVMIADTPDTRAFVDGDELLQRVPVVADGRMVVVDTDTRGAMIYNSVLSVPYTLDHLVPMLAEALR
jgi:iron complex transport system substrate-binding protein